MIDTISFDALKWHHITNPNAEDLEFLEDNFHFHPLDIDDCCSLAQRPKIDIYDNYYFLVLHFPIMEKLSGFVKTEETKVFWGKDFIITVGSAHYVVQDLFNLMKIDPEILEGEGQITGTSDAILYNILHRMMKEAYLLLEKIGGEIEMISRDLFSGKAEKQIERISKARKNIIHLNTIFKPQLRLFHKFESGEIEGFEENLEDYWGNLLDFYQKMWDMVEDYGELVAGLSNTFDSLQANKTNEIMKVLTLISTIVLPLTFLSGLYGMNVALPMQNFQNTFWIIMVICVLIIIAFFLYFKKKRWM